MGLYAQIKNNKADNVIIQTSEEQELEKIFNKMFYLEADVINEPKFVKHVLTRGQEGKERIGLHCSSVIVSDSQFCMRRMVLSLVFKQLQGSEFNVGTKRIFENGNYVHEKWQRLLIRAKYATYNEQDNTNLNQCYMMSYSPDTICQIPEFSFKHKMVGEYKSSNTFVYKKLARTPPGKIQVMMYMYMKIHDAKLKNEWNETDYTKSYVLVEDKNDQNYRLFLYDYYKDEVEKGLAKYIDRLDDIKWYYEKKEVPERKCKTQNNKQCEECNMRDACWDIGMGRIKIPNKLKWWENKNV